MLVWKHLNGVQTALPALLAFKDMALLLNRKVDVNSDETLICNESLWSYIKTCGVFSNGQKCMNIFLKKHQRWECKKLYKLYKVYGCMEILFY